MKGGSHSAVQQPVGKGVLTTDAHGEQGSEFLKPPCAENNGEHKWVYAFFFLFYIDFICSSYGLVIGPYWEVKVTA